MKQLIVTVSTVLVLVLSTTHILSVQAQEPHGHQHEGVEKIGKVTFKVSCNRLAQQKFNRAVAWLHSFEYEPAERMFMEVAAADPNCAMAYWGMAMSQYHPLWAPPSAAELEKGALAAQKASTVGKPTSRERDYIAAIQTFYKDYASVDHRTRAFAYADAMQTTYQENSADIEAGIFYALSLIAKGQILNDKAYVNEKKAAEILNRALMGQPQHPGLAHYIIHSYDSPALAHLALKAARSYARIAPASAHAQHMPSHIFTRLGYWQESIRSNLDAKAAAEAYAAKAHMEGAWDEQLHAMDYLAYAYLQGAQDKQALGVIQELERIKKAEPQNFKIAYAFTAIPARYALERRRWEEAANLKLPDGALSGFPWQKFPWAVSHIHFARAVGAARSGNTKAAAEEVEKLNKIKASLVVPKGEYDWVKQVEIERQVASAWLAHAEGNEQEAVSLMSSAAALDDATDKHPVTPGAITPAREQLAELLLEIKKPDAALMEFETSLRNAPNRFNGLYGALRAAKLAGNTTKAELYSAQLTALCAHADSDRPEVAEIKAGSVNALKQ